jgi:hypothetical protein
MRQGLSFSSAREGFPTIAGRPRPFPCQAFQKALELSLVSLGQRCEKSILDALHDNPCRGEAPATRLRQLNGVCAAIRWIGAPLGQALPLELVDEVDHRGLVGAQRLGQPSLAQVPTFSEQAQDGSVGDREVQGTQGLVLRLAKPPMSPLEQEADLESPSTRGHDLHGSPDRRIHI